MAPDSISQPTAPAARLLGWLDCEGAQYRLTRFMLLRFTGLVYFVAFLSAAQQFIPLVGHQGLLPADLLVEQVVKHHGSAWVVFWQAPSVFWFYCSDSMILAVTWGGVVLSLLVLSGYANSLIMLALWGLYFSLHGIGQEWFGYGWDIQILETGFLGVILCPMLNARPFAKAAPPVVVIWLYRWLIFRIMLGAGLIKWRGDPCWQDLTALYCHYETQPIPNPLSYWLHFMPKWFHRAGVVWNHIVELIVPWFAFVGRWPRHIAGFLMLSFQGILICSGNLSFLNWLTIIPCLACFDDSFWSRVLPKFIVIRALVEGEPTKKSQRLTSLIYASVVLWLSIDPVKNLVSSSQAMNTSFDPLHLVNTYGAFGSIDRERYELVFQGTSDEIPGLLTYWQDYEFKAKPTNIKRRPVITTPYHYRLDWAAWFPWSQVPGRNAWVPNFIWKLLHNDPGTLSLLAGNPFPDAPPKFIRVLIYRYKFDPDRAEGAWWTRERMGTHIDTISINSPQLLRIVKEQGWGRE